MFLKFSVRAPLWFTALMRLKSQTFRFFPRPCPGHLKDRLVGMTDRTMAPMMVLTVSQWVN